MLIASGQITISDLLDGVSGRNLLSHEIAKGGNCVDTGRYSITLGSNNLDTYFRLKAHADIAAGETYTISCEAEGIGEGLLYLFGIFEQANSEKRRLRVDRNGRCACTFVSDRDVPTGTTFILDDLNRTACVNPVTLSLWKLEKGNHATEWTPAPEDTDEKIDGIAQRVTTTESSIRELAGEMLLKASQTTVDELLQDMSSAQVDINGVASQISMAVSQLQRVQDELTDKVSAGQLDGRFAELSMGLEGLNIALGSLTDVEDKVGALVDFQRRYDAVFHFGTDGLSITQGETPGGIRLAADGVHFLSDTGAEVAYINGYRMYITSVEITGSLTMGRYSQIVLENGALVTVFNG